MLTFEQKRRQTSKPGCQCSGCGPNRSHRLESSPTLQRSLGNQYLQRVGRGEDHDRAQAPQIPERTAPSSKSSTIDSASKAIGRGGGAADSPSIQRQEVPLTDRKALFCHKCPEQKTHNIAIYKQMSSDFVSDNISFAKIFMLNHNVKLDINTSAGVIPPLYDEDEQKFKKVETIVHFCEILKDLEKQPGFPPPGGTLPSLFIPFGNQLRSTGEALGRYIPDPKSLCEAHDIKIKAPALTLVDSSSDVQSCSKVLLHEIGHAVGNVDVTESERIMGPCDPGSPQNAPIGCDPDRTHNTMPAKEVKKFCTASL